MSTTIASESGPAGSAEAKYRWRTRPGRLLGDLLHQGLTPRQVALAIAVGATIGIMPLVWGASLVGVLLAGLLRLNQPLVQAVNYACYPLQIALFYPFCRVGLWCFGGDGPATWPNWTQLTAGGEWLGLFWRANLCGLGVWLAAAPFWALLVYLPLRRLLPLRRRANPRN